LDLCPPKFRLKDAKVNTAVLRNKINEAVVENALFNVRKELEKAKNEYECRLNEMIGKISLIEGMTLRSLLCKRYSKETDHVRKRQNKKLFNLWSKQSKISPDCITDISTKGITVHERNALQFGLKHHILLKSFDKDLVKVNIEQMVDTAAWKTQSKVDFDLRDDIKRCCFKFEQQGKKLCSSRKNQHLHRTLRFLARDKSVRVCSYDKGTGVVIMDSDDYYRKLNDILQDGSKFVKVDVDDSKPKSHPIVIKQRSMNYYIRKYIPDEDLRKELLQSGTW